MEDNTSQNSSPPVHAISRFGWIIIAIFFGGFLIWAFFVDIESAALAPGKIVVAGNRRVVQHLEGGIISKIEVKNGAQVHKGQVLIKVDDTQSASKFESEHGQLLRLLVDEARLVALINNKDALSLPDIVLAVGNVSGMKEIIESQKQSFAVDSAAKLGTLKIYEQRVLAQEEQIKGAQAQLLASDHQLKLVQEEVGALLILAKEELVDRSRVLTMQREQQRLLGEKGAYQTKIAEIQEKIGETRLLLVDEQHKVNKIWHEQLREVREKLAQSEDREKAAKDIFDRTTIISPVDGTVINLAVSTLGGVVKSGETLMEIVPAHEELVVEAKVNPLDIDVVHEGLKAKVTLSALKTRTTPSLLGEVTYVSADAKTDERTQTNYYEARIHIDQNELKKLGNKKISPGMPVEVMIITGKRTPFEYFKDPVSRSFRRAFRED